MLANIKDISVTWFCPKDENYWLYRLREGSLEILEPDSRIRCSLKNIEGNEDDFEITIDRDRKGFTLKFDYNSEPTKLSFVEYRSAESSLYVHESAQHKVYLRFHSLKS